MKPSRARIIISGLVQGVGFRYFAVDEARKSGVFGYTKNLPNGAVEVVAEADKERLEDFISILKEGPFSASVSDVHVSWENHLNEFKNFSVRF